VEGIFLSAKNVYVAQVSGVLCYYRRGLRNARRQPGAPPLPPTTPVFFSRLPTRGAPTDASLLYPLCVQHFGRPQGRGQQSTPPDFLAALALLSLPWLPIEDRLSFQLNMHLTTTHASFQAPREGCRIYEPESLVQSAVGGRLPIEKGD